MKRLNYVLLLLLVLAASVLKGQDFSNKGKDFWVIYTGHVDGLNSRMALYITSDQNTSGTVSVAGNVINFTVTANQVTTVRFTNTSSPSNSVAYNAQIVGIGTNKGIHITAAHPVVVYSHILNSARSGSTLVLPTAVLGREYYVAGYKSSGNGGTARRGQFAVVATENNTTLEITPTAADGSNINAANVPFQVTLNKGDVYQYQSANDNDLTGSHVKSIATATEPCKPIAVFSGSTWTGMGCSNPGSGDNLYQQLFPFSTWGKVYYTAPFISRSYDIFRILVQDPTTVITVNGTPLNVSSLINGRYYEINTQGNNTSRIIVADKPICVFQYMITQNCDGVNSDPEMIVLNSVEQTLNDITVMSARRDLTPPNTNITNHYLNIIFKTNTLSSLKIDGLAPNSTPIAIPGTGYSYLQENVTGSTNSNPAHRIVSDSGFICIAYGYGDVESYGYNAGTNLKDLYQFVSIQNEYATVNVPSTCKNSPFFLSMTFPYQPTQIKWVFGAALNAMGINDITLNLPVFDSTWLVNSKQLYRYKINTPYSIPAVGTYPIKVLAQNSSPDGCNGQQEINYDIQVFEPPVADFNFTSSGCVSDSVRFTDNSSTFGRPAIQWFWDFADGQTAIIRNPAHLYNAPGSYNVKLAIVNDIGCLSDTTAIKTVNLATPPSAKFGMAAPYCVGKSITFTDSSTSANSAIVKWTWDFGDGSAPVVATNNSPQTHTYAAAKAYTVTLQVESTGGCKSFVFSQTVTVNPGPVASFGFSKACMPTASVQFTDLSTIADGSQAAFSYAWNFGDGGSSTNKNPVHNYGAPGPFTTLLTVTSNAGCTNSISRLVDSIYAQPQAIFTAPAGVCIGNAVNFTNQSIAPGSTVAQWEWDFGDGTTSLQPNPSHSYNVANTYTVSLAVISAAGCRSLVTTRQVIVNALPVADFTPSSPTCVGKTVSFTDISQPNGGTINKWTWNFGDGSPSSSQPWPVHAYSSTGTYTVSLQVENSQGCVSTVRSKQIVISELPKAGFSMPGNCVNDPISQFTDTSSIADGTASQFTYQWTFGDPNANFGNPNTSVVKDATHKYTATGNYNVKLVVASGAGCKDSVTQVFTINGAVPVSNFSVQNGLQHCSSEQVSISDNSTVTPGKLVKLEIFWDYAGDPTNKIIVNNPAPGAVYNHKYPDFFTPATKTYVIRVVSYSGINCLSSSQQTITLKAIPQIVVAPITPVCVDANSFQLQVDALNMTGGSFVYSGRGVTATGLFNPQLAGAGTHVISYSYSGTNGCTNDSVFNVLVYPVPTINAGVDRVVLEGGSVVLTTTAAGNGLSYLWTPSTYLNNPTAAQPTVTPKDDITYTVKVTSSEGCVASDVVSVTVLKAPTIPNVFSPNGDGVNDKWEIKYLDTYPNATVEVYNRYGQKIFESRGYSKPWDGTHKGSQLAAGTYYYIINPKNGRSQMAGYVDLIR